MAVKTFTKPMAAVFCLMLAGTMVRAASPVMSEPQKLQQVPAVQAAAAPAEKSPVADLTSQTIQPCALTLAAENPRLAKEPSRNIPGTISVATENLSPTT